MSVFEPAAKPRGRLRRALDAVDERMGISALQYPVPEHANNLSWSLGGLTAVSFLVLVVTGVYLAQFYHPMPESANQSVRDIVTTVWLGGVARGVHFWAAQAMYVLAALHLLRLFLHASYKRPREGNWLVGVAMFALITTAIFTGTVLKWDQEGFEALAHNVELAQLVGGAGLWFTSELARQVPILVRLNTAHAVIIPGLIAILLILHVLLVKRHTISPHPAIAPTGTEVDEPFTRHIRRVAAMGLVLMGILGVLAVLLPPEVGPTPVEGVEVTRPPWMFWWMFTLENLFGLSAILWGGAALFILLAIVPFADRGPERHWRKRKITIMVAGLILLTIIALTLAMALTPQASHL